MPEQRVFAVAQHIQSRMPQVPIGTFEGVIAANCFEDPFDESTKTAPHLIYIPDNWLGRFMLSGYTPERITGNLADPQNFIDWQLYHIQIWQNLQVNRVFDLNALNIIQCIAEMILSSNFSVDFANELYQYVQFLSLMNSQAIIWEGEALSALTEERMQRARNASTLDPLTIKDLSKLGTDRKKQAVGRILAQCFLWTAWQRATTLLFYLVLQAKIRGNDTHDWVGFLSVGGFPLMENV